ncbi:LOW QUALITY PROTEIN: heavy metal-associated isoprenylated plant protein 4 [Rhodamnia argentea]|uniref:LOW QUALITY PROTEIN: heavy metal-associated isoprenylated plant protein 4 n=1 Tax=Rhodamnia argentea TaxID=178133 RepID=A0A8B8QUJ5_9MYRT|nr:LOW QUALITY PROTEIN: heavy metal-associated isoprenylated plant protein 4 [Rhodamnia argentea]
MINWRKPHLQKPFLFSMAGKEEKKVVEKKVDLITAVYKVNLHCPECAGEIKRPLLRTQGVHQVEVNVESNEVKVKGTIDPLGIHKRIERLSKRKVELISPKIKIKEVEIEKKVVKQPPKELPVRTHNLKVYMHCDQCERDLRTKLIAHRGIYSVKTDIKAQTLTVQGTIEPEKLLSYIQRKVHKRAEIIPPKPEKKVEKEEEKKVERKEEEKKVTVEKEKVKIVETKDKETVELKEEKKVVEVKTKEGNPYFIHYVHAPQLFSDENPNACSVM